MQNARPGDSAEARAIRPPSGVRPHTGFAATTRILTAEGALPVDCLKVGDRIVTRNAGMQRLTLVRAQVATNLRPVILRASALGHDRPDDTLVLGPDQPVLLRDWRARALYGCASAMVPVHRLVDGTYIAFGEVQPRLRLIDLACAAPHVIYADGVEFGIGAA